MNNGYTYAKNYTVLYKWQIRNIISYFRDLDSGINHRYLESSEFSSGAKVQDKWLVQLVFKNNKIPSTYFEECEEQIDVNILNYSGHEINAHVDLFIANQNGECALQIENFSKKFDFKEIRLDPDGIIIMAALLENSFELIPEDVLTLCVKITVTDDETIIPFKRSLESSKSDMIIDYKELYKSRAFSDVTVIVGDEKVLAHKIILMARSPVLAAMFDSDMIEKKTNQVTILDITFEVFEKLLEYIYTDEVSNLDEIAIDLLEAAEKYQIKCLKIRCEESLCGSLNLENIIQMMVIADLYNADNLLKYVTKCIIADVLNVIKTQGFEDYEKANPSFGLKLFRKLAVEQNNTQAIRFTT